MTPYSYAGLVPRSAGRLLPRSIPRPSAVSIVAAAARTDIRRKPYRHGAARLGATRMRVFASAVSLLAACTPFIARAQVQSAEVTPGFTWGVGETVEHDSNLERLPGGSPTPPADTLKTTSILGSFDETYSREEISAKANVGRVFYTRPADRQFDYTAEDIEGTLASDLPYNIDTTIKASRTAALAHFADIAQPVRDVIDTKNLSGTLAFPLAVDFRGVVDGNRVQTRNSFGAFQTQDLDVTGVDGGIRYEPTTGNDVDLVARTAHGVYPNGSPSALLSPGYRDKGVDLRADWTFSGASHLQGRVGYLKRSNDELLYAVGDQVRALNRDFSGPAADLTYLWQITSVTQLTFLALRETGAAGDNNYLSAVSKSFRITPNYRPTPKITLQAFADWTRRDYFSNVLQAINIQEGLPPGTGGRVDDNHTYDASVVWTPRRWLQASLEFRRETRDSTIDTLSFKNDIFIFSIQGNFD
jgi:hypothetical protein